MSYAFDDGEVQTWLPPQELPAAVRNHTGQIRAHNAAFERLIFWYVLQINFKLEQFYCTAAQARANCAPGSLEDVGRFAGSSMKKDHRGAQLIRLLSIPQADGKFREDAALMAEMVAYCEQDVRAMRAVSKAMRQLSDDELADYHTNERINDRGLLVDVPLCQAAIKYAGEELVEIEKIVQEVTEGEITSVRSPKMRQWVLDRVGPQAKKLMETHKDGELKYSIDKSVRANLLEVNDPEQVPPAVAEVIQCADDLWASSVAKFKRLADLADDEDHRVRGAFVFAGGSATGRACVAASTLVESESGSIPISALEIGGKVLTHTGKFCKVSHVIYKGREIMYRLSVKGGGWVECTGRHMLLTAEGWKNVQELIRDSQPGNSGRSNKAVYVAAVAYDGRSGGDDWSDSRNCRRDRAGDRSASAAKDSESGELLQIEDGRKEPYVWSEKTSGSDFASRLSVSLDWGRRRICTRTPASTNESAGVRNMAGELGSSPHRQQQNQQLIRQLGNCDASWASAIALAEIEEIVCVGEKGVWDITVEGDASYIAQGLIHHNSSYGAQVHNLPRKSAKDPDAVRTAMVRGHEVVPRFGDRITDVLKGMLRPAIVAAPGHVLIAYDWSAIEGRVHPWLSNCDAGEKKLDVFRSGLDPYIVNAAATFRLPYDEVLAKHLAGDSFMRQIGKVQELALGFLGGPGAFETFGRIYGVHLSASEVQRAVDGWRRANPWAMQHGTALEGAYMRAMRNPGHECAAGRIVYLFDGQTLWYALPSGRVLCYPNAKFDEEGNVTYSKASWKPAADAKEWPRARLWRGLACENVVQATAHDLLRIACRRLDRENIQVVLTVHDEIGVECKAEDADQVAKRVHEIMCTAPNWASGLPLAAEGVTTARYS